MAKKQKKYKTGKCKECGHSMVLKPADRKFCKDRCRYQHRNRVRPRPNADFALSWVADNLTTVSQVAEESRMTVAQIRTKIRRNELPVFRLYGRILINKQDVQRLVSNSSQEVINAK
jgi:hypothetical protein